MITPLFKIVISKNEEEKFKRRALRRYPNEYMETCWGRIRENTAYIHVFAPINHKGTPKAATYDDDDLEFSADEAVENNLICLGTIHTHTNSDCTHFSEGDLLDSQDTMEMIMGIAAVSQVGKRKKIEIEYWPTVRPLEKDYKK